jgi:hypothetical protein
MPRASAIRRSSSRWKPAMKGGVSERRDAMPRAFASPPAKAPTNRLGTPTRGFPFDGRKAIHR